MKLKTIMVVLLMGAIAATAAQAQQPQPQQPAPSAPATFAPITVTEADYKILTTYLMEAVPKKYADQVMLWIESLEQRAQNDAAKAKEPPPPPKKE